MATTLVFTGDLCFTHSFRDLERKPDLLSEEIREFVMGSDYCVCNVEGPVFDPASDGEKEFLHRSGEAAADFLRSNGFNIWNLANNHIFDFKDEGLASTISLCRQSDSRWLGVGEEEPQLLIPQDGGIGLVSVTYSEPGMKACQGKYRYIDWNDLESIGKAIRSVKESCRWCVVVSHGGEEFSSLPMPETREKYHSYLELGADVVIGHHPHVVQNYENVGDKLIFYSLGNFLFDTNYERAHKHTETGLLVKLCFGENSLKWESLAVRIDREAQRVGICDKPPVFIHMDQNLYEKLLPFAARALSEAEKQSLRYFQPAKYKDAGFLTWMIRDLRLFRHRKSRAYIRAKYRSYFMKAPETELLDYLLE